MKIKLEVNNEEISRLMGRFSKESDRAHNSALNRATKKVEGELIDRTYQKINLPKSYLRQKVKVNGRLGRIDIFAESISLIRYVRKQVPQVAARGGGLKIKLWRDRGPVLYEGSFAAYGSSGNLHVFRRKDLTDSRSKLMKLHGRGVRDMWEVPSFTDGIFNVAQTEYQTRFASSFFAFIKKEMG